MVSTKAGSNTGNIDVIWKVSNMKLYLTNNTNVVKNIGKQNHNVAVYKVYTLNVTWKVKFRF